MKAVELLYIDDINEFLRLAHMMQQECEPDIEFSELEAQANVWSCLQDTLRSAMNCWIVRHEGKIIGFGVANCQKFLYSEQLIASLTLWYVQPEYRHTRAAFEILHNFENWSRLIGAKRLSVGAAKVSVEEANNINRMFIKRKFSRYGELFYRDL